MSRWRLDRLPPPLRDAFRRYHRRVRLFQTVEACIALATLYAPLVWVAMHVDRFGSLSVGQRVGVSAGIHLVVGLLGLIWLGVVHLRRLPVKRVAYSLEAKLGPAAEERYTTLADLLNQDRGAWRPEELRLLAELQEEALRSAEPRRAANRVRDPRLRFTAGLCGVVIALFLAPLASPNYEYRPMLARFYFPRLAVPKPSFVKIALPRQTGVLGQGQQFVLQVGTRGAVPRVWVWILRQWRRPLPGTPVVCLETPGDGARAIRREMTRIRDGQYLFTESRLDKSFRFQVACQDAVTDWREVEVIPVPAVTNLRVSVVPPAYSGLAPQEFEPAGQGIPLLKDSRVRVSFGVNQPVRDVEIQSDLAEKPFRPEWDEKTRTGRHSFVFRDPESLTIRVRNERGFENSHPPVLPFRVLEDQPPAVRIQAQDVLPECAATDAVSIPFQAEDDFGISEVALNVIVNPLPDQLESKLEQRVTGAVTGKVMDQVAQLDVGRLEVDPGDRILVRVRVRDSVGQNTLSPGVTLAVSAFGRGTREEARIRALRFLETALERVGESTARGRTPGDVAMVINEGFYKRVLADAAKQGVTISAASRFSSVLDLVEREHFLTECPWDKEDLRRIHGLMHLSALALGGGDDPVAERNDTLFEIHDRFLIPLVDYRELRNVMWRLFGLRDAVAEAIATPAEKLRPARIRLVFDTLDQCLARMLILSRRADALDAEALSGAIREANAARTLLEGRREYAYAAEESPFGMNDPAAQTRTAGSGDAAKALTRLRGTLSGLLSLAQAAVPGALERRARTSEGLRARHREKMRRMLDAVSGNAKDAAGMRRSALEFLEADMRLVRGNPLFPAADFAANYRATARLLETGGRGAGPAEDAGAAAFARQAMALDEVHACTELRLLAGLRNLSEAERTFAALLTHLELVSRPPGNAEGKARLGDELKRLTLAEPPAVRAGILLDPESVCTSAGVFLQVDKDAATALGALETKSVQAQAELVRRAFLDTQAQWGDPEKAKDALDRERHVLRQFVDRLQLALSAIPDAGGKPDVAASFFLKLRAFRDRPRAQIHLLTDAPGEGRLTREQLDDIDLDKALLKRHRDAVLQRLEGILAVWNKGEVQALTEYQDILLGQIRETAFFADVGARLATETDRVAWARRFIGGSEEAAVAYLNASLGRLDAITARFEGARQQAMRKKALDPDTQAVLAEACKDLGAYARDMEAVQASDFRKRLTGELARIETAMAGLARGAQEVNAAIYQAGTLIEKLRDLSRETAAFSSRVGLLRFTGGALELEQVSAVRADEAGRHLAERFKAEREALCEAVFAALEPKPRSGIWRMALPHAAFLHRLVRGDLVRYRPVVPIVSSGQEKSDYAAFLMEELDKASKVKVQQYSRTVRVYLGRMGSFAWEIPKP